MKRTALKKISQKQILKIEEKKKLIKEDHKFYQEIWEERKHTCYESGKYLGEEALTTFFHHILPKEVYPQYRHHEWNIVILSPKIHGDIELGGLDKAPKVKQLYLELYEKYHTFIPNL